MNKNYSRNNLIGISQLLLGIVLMLGMFRVQNFILIYDGVKIGAGVLLIFSGIWCLTTPLVRIRGNIIKIRETIFVGKSYDISLVKEIGYDKATQVLRFDGNAFKLKKMGKSMRIEFINDLKSARQSK
jgi:hypothetical protein